MLKAGKTIKIDSKVLKHNNSIEIAKSFNIHGLIIQADKPIEPDTLRYLKECGVSIDKILEEGETFLRMSGKFKISKSQVKEFLDKISCDNTIKPNSCDGAGSNLEPFSVQSIPIETNFQKYVNAKLKLLNKKYKNMVVVPSFYLNEGTQSINENGNLTQRSILSFISTIKTSSIISQAGITLTSGGAITSSGSECAAKKNIIYHANTMASIAGVTPVEGAPVGILAEFTAGKDLKITGEERLSIKDSVLFAYDDIELSSDDEVYLGLNPEMEWHNTPIIPSIVEVYEKQLEQGSQARLIREEIEENVRQNCNPM